MKKVPIRMERPQKAEYEPSLENTAEERLAIEMVLELTRRFGLWQPHDVALVLKVSTVEAKRLLVLAAEKTGPR